MQQPNRHVGASLAAEGFSCHACDVLTWPQVINAANDCGLYPHHEVSSASC